MSASERLVYKPRRIEADYWLHLPLISTNGGHLVIIQTAAVVGESAEVVGTMKHFSMGEKETREFWNQFKEMCQSEGVKYLFAWVLPRLATHYIQNYPGMMLTEERKEDEDLGTLVKIECNLEQTL